MKKLLLALLIATPAFAQQTEEMQAQLAANGVQRNCYPVGFTTTVQTVCRGHPGWNVEVQQLFNTFNNQTTYLNSFGVPRTLGKDTLEGFGIGPWVQNYVLKEFQQRGVKL